MKMVKHFDLPVDGDDVSCLAYKEELAAAALAINCHDELVAVLGTCEAYVAHFQGGWSSHTPGNIDTAELLATIRAILKKAKGE